MFNSKRVIFENGYKKRSRTFLPDFKLQPDALKEKDYLATATVAYSETVFTVLIILAATL